LKGLPADNTSELFLFFDCKTVFYAGSADIYRLHFSFYRDVSFLQVGLKHSFACFMGVAVRFTRPNAFAAYSAFV
jgi:hypothetical protein